MNEDRKNLHNEDTRYIKKQTAKRTVFMELEPQDTKSREEWWLIPLTHN